MMCILFVSNLLEKYDTLLPIKKPSDIKWAFTVGGLGQYEFDAANAIEFGLHNSERTEIILRILLYQGIVIRDPQVVQVAAQQVKQQEINEKS